MGLHSTILTKSFILSLKAARQHHRMVWPCVSVQILGCKLQSLRTSSAPIQWYSCLQYSVRCPTNRADSYSQLSNWPEKKQSVENLYEAVDFDDSSERKKYSTRKLMSENGKNDKFRLHIEEAQVP